MSASNPHLISLLLCLFIHSSFGQLSLPDTPISHAEFVSNSSDYLPFTGNPDKLSTNQKLWLISVYKASAYKYKNRYPDSAIYVTNIALGVAEKFNLKTFIPSIYFQLGNFYSIQGYYYEAIQNYYTGIRYCERDSLYPSYKGYPYISVGNLFYKLEQYERAEDFFKRAKALFEMYPYKKWNWGKSVALNNIALCKLKQNEPKEALTYFENALTVRLDLLEKGQTDSLAILHCYIYIQKAYRQIGDLSNAQKFLNKSDLFSALLTKSENGELMRQVALENAELLSLRKRYKQAIELIELAFNQSEKTTYNYNNELYINAQKQKIFCLQKLNKHEEALKTIESTKKLASVLKNHRLLIELLNYKLESLSEQKKYQVLPKLYSEMQLHNDTINKTQKKALGLLFDFNMQLASAKQENNELHRANLEVEKSAKKNKLLAYVLIISLSFVLLSVILISILYKRALKTKAIEISTRRHITNLINAIDNTIICLSLKGNIILINTACVEFYKQILGVNLKEGDNLLKILENSEKLKLWTDILEKLKTTQQSWIEERHVAIQRPIYLHRTITPTFNSSGTLNGLIAVGTDVTAAKEQEIKLKNQKLKLDESDAAKQQMLNLLAHDLKDVIYSSESLTQLIIDDPEAQDKEGMLEYFKMLNVNFKKNKRMMEGMLDWAKTQVKGLKAELNKIYLVELVKGCLDEVSEKALEKGVSLKNNIAEDYEVLADSNMIHVVLRNLVNNAIKFTEKNTGEVHINITENKDTIIICVEDNGVGLSSKQIKDILNKKVQTQTSGTLGEQGAGFGLNISKEYLQLNHSKLIISSEKGAGSKFCFALNKA